MAAARDYLNDSYRTTPEIRTMITELVADRRAKPEAPSVDRSSIVREAVASLYRQTFGERKVPSTAPSPDTDETPSV